MTAQSNPMTREVSGVEGRIVEFEVLLVTQALPHKPDCNCRFYDKIFSLLFAIIP